MNAALSDLDTVTAFYELAFYELVPTGGEAAAQPATALKYQRVVEPTEAAAGGESLTLSLRYKPPEANESLQLSTVVNDGG
jgi:hypothetical protein